MTSYATCAHFRGSQTSCRADIDVETLRDEHGRLPCAVMRGITGSASCDRIAMPVAAIAEVGRMLRGLERVEAGLCHQCGEEVTGMMDFNDNILALPCRHTMKHARD